MQRVRVVGNSGAGKTTFARALSARLGVPHTELDSIFHQADWRPLEREEFRRRVGEVVAAPGWVVDGNYSAVADLVLARADSVVWLDPPRAVVMRQVIRRTVRRALTGEELWNGNREPISGLYARRPTDNLIVWAWTHHNPYRRRFTEESIEARERGLAVYRIRSRDAVAAFLRDVGTDRARRPPG